MTVSLRSLLDKLFYLFWGKNFFHSTSKVEGNKVLLYFHLWIKWSRYWYLLVFIIVCLKMIVEKTTKWPYLSHFASKWKKGTLFSSTLKVKGIKILLFFISGLNGWDSAIYLLFHHFLQYSWWQNNKMAISWSFCLKMKK